MALASGETNSGGHVVTDDGYEVVLVRSSAGAASIPTTATPATVSTATLSNVNDTNVSTTVLAANTSRKGAYFFNDSTVTLYLKLGATASLTSHTVQILGGSYYELPQPVYTGIIDGIWASDATGAVRVTELT